MHTKGVGQSELMTQESLTVTAEFDEWQLANRPRSSTDAKRARFGLANVKLALYTVAKILLPDSGATPIHWLMAAHAFDLPKIGSRFADQFEVLELIGQGGMGVVYRARQLKLQREVALKVLRPSAVAGGYEQFRLEREAVSAARFRSQHVVDIYDWGVSAEGLTYLVMELLHGETLADRLDRQGVLEPAQVAAWLRQCSEALDEAAALGIVHRDIKPANLFLATTPSAGTTEIKILDFGITKVFDETRATFQHEGTTQSSLRMGTTRYMSPEQLRATSSVDARADIWSLGVVAYQALCGSYPFDHECEADLIVSILSDQPPRLHLVNAKLSPAVADVVARALEKNADARYRSAGEFARALSAALAHYSIGVTMEAPASVRPAALLARLAPLGLATDAGLETSASHDSLRVERRRPQLRATRILAIAGGAFALSSALAVAATTLLPTSAPSGEPPKAAAPPSHRRDAEPQQLPVHVDSVPVASAAAIGRSESARLAPARPPSPKLAGSSLAKRQLPRLPAPPHPSALPTQAVVSAPAAAQFERDNPYAN
jgi:eukaryotic-like serine/threonine-protein kinase